MLRCFADAAKRCIEVRVLIVGSYFQTPLRKLWSRVPRADRIIAVDGGLAELARLGIQADAAVGDWDSLPPRARARLLAKTPHLTLSQDKDRSDLFYGLALAIGAGANEIVCVGVTGGRPDHHLATLFDLTEAARDLKSLSAIDSENTYHWVSPRAGTLRMKLTRGTPVAIFSMDGTASGVKLSGLKYPLRGGKLEPSSHGISNVATGSAVSVSVRKGVLLALARKATSRA